MRTIAITRPVPASIATCELTYLARSPIDVGRARRQHAEYVRALADLGCEVIELAEAPELPDSVFVEDTALVFDECAMITRPGAVSRRAETDSIRTMLAPYRELYELLPPATLDGGDVLCVGRNVFVGISTRTNQHGVQQLDVLLRPFGYHVRGVAVQGCLHLKSAVSIVARDLLVVNTEAIDPAVFATPFVSVPAHAANMLEVSGTVLCPAAAAATAAELEQRGLRVMLIDNSELAKAEGGLTCCSLLLKQPAYVPSVGRP